MSLDHFAADAESRFADLVGRHGDRMRAYCARRVRSDAVDDLVSEVFTIAWTKFEEIPPGRELQWLYGVAYRVVSQQWRTTRRRGRLSERLSGLRSTTPDPVETQISNSEDHAMVLRAAAALRPIDREILRLTLWEELPHADVASVLDLDVGAVRQRASRARRALAAEYRRLVRIDDSRATDGGAL